MSNSLPWMPLNIGEYLAGTMALSAAEHGAFLLLLMHKWQTGEVPNNPKHLARIARMSEQEWSESSASILELFHDRFWGTTVAERAVSREARVGIPRDLRVKIFERDGSVCAYCRTENGPFHLDHIIPFSRGGTNDPLNLTVACAPCNLSKKDRTPEEWLQ